VPLLIGMVADEPSALSSNYDAAKATATRSISLRAIDQLLTTRAQSSKQPAYAYYFEHVLPWPAHPEYGAFHSSELPYVFDNLAILDRPWTATDRTLAVSVSHDWVTFTADGVPAGDASGTWPAYQPGTFNFMVFGDRAAVRDLSALVSH
jgi:para-nitrobenzyl esterase